MTTGFCLLWRCYLWRGSAVMKVNLYLFINSLRCGRVKLLSQVNVFNDLSGVFECFVPLAWCRVKCTKSIFEATLSLYLLVYNVCICISIVLACMLSFTMPKGELLTLQRNLFKANVYYNVSLKCLQLKYEKFVLKDKNVNIKLTIHHNNQLLFQNALVQSVL